MTITVDRETIGSGDRYNTLVAMVIARAWRDPDYRARLIQTPKTVLAEEGLEIPGDVEVRVVADTETARYVVLEAGLAEGADSAAALDRAIASAAGWEVRLVQNTARTLHVGLPLVPDGIEPDEMSEMELTRYVQRIDDCLTNAVAVTNVIAAANAISVVVVAVGVAVVT